MPKAIVYCDSCNKIVLPSEIKDGGAAVSSSASLCRACLNALETGKREKVAAAVAMHAEGDKSDALATESAESEDPVARRHRGPGHRHKTAAAPRPSSPKMAVPAVAIAAALVTVAVVLALSQGDSSGRNPQNLPVAPAHADPSATAPAGTAAAHELARIRAMRTPDLAKYAEIRRMLVRFPERFAGTPEAESAKALLLEVDRAWTKLADEALAAALAAARAGASRGEFEDAEAGLRSLEGRFGDGTWFESKGRAAVAEALAEVAKQRSAWELKNVAAILEKAREELAAGRLEEAGRLISGRAKWPAESRARADRLAAEIERKLAAAAAAKKLGREREAILAEFDRLMSGGEHAAAGEYAESKAAAGGRDGELLRAAGRVARAMAEAPEARVRGARTLIGREVRLRLVKKQMTAVIRAATDEGLAVARTFTINNQTRERDEDVKWDALHAEQRAELARLGGLTMSPSDAAIALAYEALASGDLDAAGRAAEAARGHPLGARLVEVVRARRRQLAYDSAMELAEELAEKERWEDAARECEKALALKPEDKRASELLAEARRHIAPPPEEVRPGVRRAPAGGMAVVRLVLVNAPKGEDLMALEDGMTIPLSELPTRELNVRAETSPEKVGSVVLELAGRKPQRQVEDIAPYTLFTDHDGQYVAGSFKVGEHTLTATPYSRAKGGGRAGQALTIRFRVVE
ncbi:MAG: hypothetical protein ACYS9X_04160 [Planctomycetota bacterium]